MKFHKNQVPWRAWSVISQCSKYLWETSPAHTNRYIKPQYLDVLSGEIEKNLYKICILYFSLFRQIIRQEKSV